MTQALFVGLTVLDIAYGVESYPAEDTKTRAADQFLGAGGPAANAAVAYAALAGRTPTLITALGSHPLAGIVRDDLDRHRVAIVDTAPGDTQPPPVSSIVVARRAGSRTIVSLDDARIQGRFAQTLTRHLASSALVLVDGHHPELALGMAAAARRAGVPVVLDGGRWKDVHRALLPLTDIAICSSAFTPPGIAPDDAGAVIDFVHAAGPGTVAITRGAQSIRYSLPTGRGELDVPSVDAVDTLGAGDILHGAFCHYHSAGRGFLDALRAAAEVAALRCRYFGTRRWHDEISCLP